MGEPRVWTLPDEPGPEVTAVRDQFGQRFERGDAYDGEHEPESVWVGTAFTTEADVPELVLSWETLYRNHAPLVDATADVLPAATDD